MWYNRRHTTLGRVLSVSEQELRKHRCCFTGHRPEKLTIPEKRLTVLLEAEIKRAIDSSHTTFITGMA